PPAAAERTSRAPPRGGAGELCGGVSQFGEDARGRFPRGRGIGSTSHAGNSTGGVPMNRSMRKVARALILVGAVVALLPAAAQAYINAGFRSRAEYEAYLKEKERRENPREPEDFYTRGCLRGTSGLWERAIADFDHAIRLSPEFGRAFVARGTVRWKQEEYAKAIAAYRGGVGLAPGATPACLRLAVAYGTCPEAKLRSPARAIATAKGACELSGYRDPNCVQVLAALHAQAGNFE